MNDTRDSLLFEARCWVFGDNIPTDEIVRSELVFEPLSVMAQHVLEGHNASFPKEVQPGDVVVTGHHFGQSSGRALAPKALQATGLGCIVAESFARTFLRNSFEIGLPIMECPGIAELASDGDTLEVDIARGQVTNRTSGASITTTPPDEFLLRMLQHGGLIPLVRQDPGSWTSG